MHGMAHLFPDHRRALPSPFRPLVAPSPLFLTISPPSRTQVYRYREWWAYMSKDFSGTLFYNPETRACRATHPNPTDDAAWRATLDGVPRALSEIGYPVVRR